MPLAYVPRGLAPRFILGVLSVIPHLMRNQVFHCVSYNLRNLRQKFFSVFFSAFFLSCFLQLRGLRVLRGEFFVFLPFLFSGICEICVKSSSPFFSLLFSSLAFFNFVVFVSFVVSSLYFFPFFSAESAKSASKSLSFRFCFASLCLCPSLPF